MDRILNLGETYGPTREPVADSTVVSVATHEERLRNALVVSDVRVANLRLALGGSSPELVEQAVLDNIQGVMDELDIGPKSPYLTHHAVAAVARMVAAETLQASCVIPPGQG